MSHSLLSYALIYAQFALVIGGMLACWRVVAGPRAHDRVLGIDTLYINIMLLTLVIGIRAGSPFFFEVAAVIAFLGFAATVALAKFLLRGEVIE
ncbi:MAG: K+/H+ antiporter subunit F [Paracoccus sp. (in: a-proteobacteria)]|uniref:K+/H+ antiporter subunit F n=1 Tax=Paracoccus sp. TaxID=267 RepID=UPI0026DF0715|nr:K+/H+ antiporter subunit F [Paracoccus sp. (in: a-proteobacteria)]MDO5620294.1 K+/H+ antiporter subunit F [Paracoccus sp. (in: a-proteobacteria)]